MKLLEHTSFLKSFMIAYSLSEEQYFGVSEIQVSSNIKRIETEFFDTPEGALKELKQKVRDEFLKI